MSEKFLSKQDVEALARNDAQVKEQIGKAPPEVQAMVAEVNNLFNEMVEDVFDFESERRVRNAGFLPSEAEGIARHMKARDIQIGQVFQYQQHTLVKTPFNTVVKVQQYVTALQDRLFEVTTVHTELEISNLKKTINEFTSLTFFGLIKLAFKKLTYKGKSRG